MGVRVATIDLGSNTLILLIAEKDSASRIKILCDEARITRLGEGLKVGGNFLPAAMDRTAAVLKNFRARCDELQVEKIVAAGTAAFRKVADPKPFIDRIRRECGIEIRVISGDDEALSSYQSVVRDFGKQYKNVAALDIGGGSTELVLSDTARVSLPLGTVALKEELLLHDPPTQDELVRLRKKIRDELGTAPTSKIPVLTLVGLAGTCTTLAAVDQQLAVYDPDKVQGYILTHARLKKWINTFRPLDVAALKQLPGMDPGRADTILAGAILLEEVIVMLGLDRVVVSDRGLRFGMLYLESIKQIGR